MTDADIQDHLENIAGSGNWRYTVAADDSVEIYDTTGKLLTLTDRAGHTQTLSYDAAGKLTAVTDTFGRSLSFTYDASGHIVTMTDPAGGAYNYTYDAAGNLASVAYPDGSSKTYHYEDPNFPNALTGISDENGNRYATYAYDVQGRAISSEHANGADRVSLAYNTDGTTTVTDVLGATRIYGFQTILGVVKSSGVSQPGGAGCSAASSALTYDANGNTASRDDFNGHHTHYWYDQGFATTRNLETTRTEGLAVANGTEQVQPETRTLTTAWHASFRLPTLEKLYSGGANSSGVPSGTLIKTTVYTYDATGNLTALSETDNVRNETRTRAWAYTSLGRVLTADGPRSDVADITTYAYYPDADADADLARRGQLWKIANALGHVIEILAYDLHGHPTQIKNPNGLISALAYDARGRLTTRTAGSHVTAYTYDAAGQLTGVTRPDGSQTTYGYDAAHRLTSIQDAQGNRIDYTLDGQGNRIAETVSDAQGNPVRNLNRTFDTLGRLWQEIRIVNGQNAITAYSHDAQGNLAGRSDPLAHTSTYAYDALNRLIRSQDAQGGATVTAYDTLDQATRITAPNGLATIYTRDAFGQVRHEVSPDTGATTYTYDPAGNLKTRTDARGVVTTYTYDALNRLTQVYWNSDNYVTFQYDSGPNSISRLSQMNKGKTSTTWSYDPYGAVTGKQQSVRGIAENLLSAYDNSGRLSQLSYPSGKQITYSYNQGQLNQIKVNGQVLLNNLQYQPFGPPKSWTWGNGTAYSRTFDANGWPQSHPLGNLTRNLAYDAAGRLTGYNHPGQPNYNQTFGYDAVDRLTGATTYQGSQTYTYDANGNRSQLISGTVSYPYTYIAGSNRLQSVAGPVAKTYRYAAAGNISSDGINQFFTDASGRLNAVSNRIESAQYMIDGLGQRVGKYRTSAGDVSYVYAEDGKLLGEYDGSGQAILETVWLGETPAAVLKGGNIYFIHADHLNAPRVITDSQNRIVWRWTDAGPFGDGLPNENPSGLGAFNYNLRLPGQYYDQETGLHYNYFRDYEPRTGRYVQSDPIGLTGGINPYANVSNNPLSNIDPLGLFDIVVTDYGGRNGPTYGGMMTVLGENGRSVTVPVSSWPNPSNPSPGVAPETYFGTYGPRAHQGSKPGVRVNNGGNVQTLGPNPAQRGAGYASGVNVHCGYRSNKRGSAGCITVEPMFCKDVWDVLQPSETGVVTITR